MEYGLEDLDRVGFTQDISVGGIFLVASHLEPVGRQLHLKISSADRFFYAEGLVVRHKAVATELRRLERQGMGVRFLRPSELVDRVLPAHLRGPSLSLQCKNQGELDKLIAEQLERRVVLVPAGSQAPVAEQVVEFEVRLAYLEDSPATIGKGRVVQILEGCFGPGEAGRGAVIEVENAPKLIAALRKLGG